MRASLLVLHRGAGLLTALFLFIAGLTGAVISWDHELDEWLNPHLFDAPGPGPSIPYLELATRIEAADPRARVTVVPLQPEPGQSLLFRIQPRVDPHTGRIGGIPGRIFISVMGVFVAMLSVTGVVIWLRRRGALVTKKPALGKLSDRSLAT